MASGPQRRLWKNRNSSRHLHTFGGEVVGVAGAVALQEPVTFQLAEIVAELVQPVGCLRESKRGEDGLMDLSGSPAADGGAAMQEDFR